MPTKRNSQKKKSTKNWLAQTPFWLKMLGLLMLFLVGLFLYRQVKHTYYRYQNFGILLPPGNYIHGIDVSHYQGKIDWNDLENMEVDGVQLDFAYVKATEGTFLRDRYFKRNWKELEKTRLKQGVYHFFRCRNDGLDQAKFFLSHYTYQDFHLPPVLDIEDADGVSPILVQERAKAWIRHVQAETGTKPIIYSNPSFYEEYLSSDAFFDDYPLWIANYYRLSPKSPRKWHFWQHSDRGNANGIGGYVDFNVFKGSRSDLLDFIEENKTP